LHVITHPPLEDTVVTEPAKDRSFPAPAAIAFDARALRRRRFRIISYFVSVGLHFLWWDYLLKWSLLKVFRTPWVPRWRRLTEQYKDLALDLQGLWVKLGQFLSTRVDVLPVEITRELDSLRDEVPAVGTETLIAQIEADFGAPVGAVFSWISPRPIGSASLAQVHRAQTVTGESVVVKVLRPGIRETIRTDLGLLRQAAGWLKMIKPIAQRADIDAIIREFDTVTTKELDLRLEARNSEHFAEDFAADAGVAIPRIYHEQSSSSTLTMEDVSYIRIDDLAALERAGIDAKAVARKVYNVYLRQFFVTYRVHADPHPGNLFIRPLPTPEEIADHPLYWDGYHPGDVVPHAADRPFQLVIVDFGMVVEMPARLRDGLREFAIGLGTRDSRRILDAYFKVGVLRPGANLERVQEMIQAQLDSFWGTFLGQMRESDLSSPEAQAFFAKYQGLMTSTPFQFQTDMLFMTRAMGILSGVTLNLDPEFDAWKETSPFAQRLIRDDVTNVVRRSVEELVAGRLPTSLGSLLRLFPVPPSRSPQTAVAVDASSSEEEVRRLRRSVNRLRAVVVAGALLVIGAVLQAKGVRVSDAEAFLWAGNNLGKWAIEIAVASILIVLLRRNP
jgi:predicted unusual protein kinase regulating ubiquinone biosynthesis (AarF/ABC1/UbiB family)